MTLKDRIVADMKTAMREKNTPALDAIRMLRAAIQRREVDERSELDDDGVIQVIGKLVKQGNDAAGQFIDGGRDDLAQKEKAGIAVLQAYLPEALSEEEIENIIRQAVSESGAAGMKDMGRVMGMIKPRLQGRADMGQVSARLRGLLS